MSQVAVAEELELWYDDCNGHIFHISGGDQEGNEGVTLATEAAGTVFEDIFESPIETIYNSTAFEIGGRYGGLREDMFEFVLAFNIKPTDNLPWRVTDSRFRKALKFARDGEGRIFAKIRGVSTRYLTVCLMGSVKVKTQTDPNRQKYGLALVRFVAAFPRWCEDDYTNSWVCATDTTAPNSVAAPTLYTPVVQSTNLVEFARGVGTQFYRITSLGASGETTGSNELSVSVTDIYSQVVLPWSNIYDAEGYSIYTSTATGAEKWLATVGADINTYTDVGLAVISGANPIPTSNTATGMEVGQLTVFNPTNNAQWLKFVAQAGNAGVVWSIPDYSWGSNLYSRAGIDASRMIIMPPLINGENVVVDTDEMTLAGQVVSSLDTAIYLRMNGATFLYSVPAYTPPTPIPVAVSGARIGNGIQVRVPQTWSRPWGLD